MKRTYHRVAAAAVASAALLSLTIPAGAYQWWTEGDGMGKLVQAIREGDEAEGFVPVQLLSVGSLLEFDGPVDVAIYGEGEYGVYAPTQVAQDVTQFTIGDDDNTYVVTSDDGGIAMFRGSGSVQAPVTLVGDLSEGSATLQLSKPVVDIVVEELESTYYDYDGNPVTEKTPILVYYISAGTTISPKFGSEYLLLNTMWDPHGKEIGWEDFKQTVTSQFPDYPFDPDSEFGYTPYLPLTLNEVGYYYQFIPEALASAMPVFKVVEDTVEYTPRVAQFDDMNWSKEYVEKVYAYGWMDGMGDGKFNPQGNLTIAQAVTLLARISAVQAGRVIPASEGAWYQTYLDYCMDHYLLRNVDGVDLEDPAALNAWMNQEATRMDMVKILSGVASVPGLGWDEEETVSVPDVSKDELGGELVYDWYRNGIVGGDAGTGAFRPDAGITRGEVAVILCNLLGL